MPVLNPYAPITGTLAPGGVYNTGAFSIYESGSKQNLNAVPPGLFRSYFESGSANLLSEAIVNIVNSGTVLLFSGTYGTGTGLGSASLSAALLVSGGLWGRVTVLSAAFSAVSSSAASALATATLASASAASASVTASAAQASFATLSSAFYPLSGNVGAWPSGTGTNAIGARLSAVSSTVSDLVVAVQGFSGISWPYSGAPAVWGAAPTTGSISATLDMVWQQAYQTYVSASGIFNSSSFAPTSVYIKSPNNSIWKISVDNSGVLSSTLA